MRPQALFLYTAIEESMPLISCSECNKQVSNLAVSCPSCGAPINIVNGRKANEKSLYTTQVTHKKLKVQQVVSRCIFFIGLIWLIIEFVSANDPVAGTFNHSQLELAWPITMVLIGIIWQITTKIKIWWHHK